jgi:O-antigen/teichoic acid export membrane protein
LSLIKKNFLYNLLLTVSTIIFPIVTFPYATRILGPEGIGKVQFVTSFAQYFILIAALGIPVYGIREVAKRRNDQPALEQFFTEMVMLNVLTSVLFSFVYMVLVYTIPSLRVDQTFYNVAILMIVFSFCNIDWFFSGLERFKFIAGRSLLVKLIGLVLLFVFVRHRTDDINFLGITVCIALLNNFWNLWSARSYLKPSLLSLQAFKQHSRPMLFIFSTVAAISIYGFLDTVILGFLKGYEQVGYYTAASKITKITIPVLTALGTVLIPQISQAFKNKNMIEVQRLASYSFDFVIILGVPMTFGLIALAPELIIIFSGKAFAPAILAMQIFSPVILIIGLSNVWAIQILTPAGKDRNVTTSVAFGVVVSLILNFFLIPFLGYIGAAIANVASEFVVMCGFAYFSSFVLKQSLHYKLILQTVLISSTFIPITWFVRVFVSSNNVVICGITTVISAVVYITFQALIMKNQLLLTQINTMTKRFRKND